MFILKHKCIHINESEPVLLNNCEILNDGEQSNLEYEKIFEGNNSNKFKYLDLLGNYWL